MEPEYSLPCSHGSGNDPYPERDAHSSDIPTPFPQDSFKYNIPIYAYVFRVVTSHQIFQPKFCTNFLSLPCVLHATPMSSSLILSP